MCYSQSTLSQERVGKAVASNFSILCYMFLCNRVGYDFACLWSSAWNYLQKVPCNLYNIIILLFFSSDAFNNYLKSFELYFFPCCHFILGVDGVAWALQCIMLSVRVYYKIVFFGLCKDQFTLLRAIWLSLGFEYPPLTLSSLLL